MFLAGVIPILYIALPMLAGALMMIIVIEINWQWAFVTYIASGLLSLFLTFDKEAALIYILLFGHYPILKFIIDKIKIKPAAVIIKFIIYNICIFAYFYAAVYLLGSKELINEINKFGKYGALLILFIADSAFFIYDSALNSLIYVYKDKIKPKIIN